MSTKRSAGDVIHVILRDHGESVLLDASRTLALFEELAPRLKRDKELLSVFMVCHGATRMMDVRYHPYQEQLRCMQLIEQDLCSRHHMPEKDAHHICQEFYRGLTGRKWQDSDSETKKTVRPPKNPEPRRTTPMPKWLVGIALLIIALVAFYFMIHSWTDATCTDPARCRICGKTGATDPLGHDWQAGNCTTPARCRICGKQEANAPGHEWSVGDCTTPAQCQVCGATDSSNLGHDWTAADCTNPSICTRCGITDGEPLDHNWIEATYSAPRTCSQCNLTEGDVLGYPLVYCPVLETSNYEEDIAIGTWEDPHGNIYDDAIRFWVVERPRWYDTERIIFDLEGQYRTLSGTVACEAATDDGGSVSILIYGDGVLLYESQTVGRTGQPFTFTVDVSGISQLRIDCTTDSYAFSYGIVQAVVRQ